MTSSWIRVRPKCNVKSAYKRWKRRDTHGGECHVKTQADIGLMLPGTAKGTKG